MARGQKVCCTKQLPPFFQCCGLGRALEVRDNKVLSSEKQQSSKTVDDVKAEAQTFHRFIHSVHKSQFFKIHDDDTANCDKMPMSLTSHMKREIKSLVDRGLANEVRLSPFNSKDFKRSMTVVLTARCLPTERDSEQSIQPFLIFHVRGKPREVAMYDNRVRVTYQENAVVDSNWFLHHYLPVWKKWQAKPGGQKFLVYDSASAHLARAVKHEFDKADT